MINKQFIRRSLLAFVLFVCSIQAQTLRRVTTIELPGPKGQLFDYLAMDDEDHWLLSAHLEPGVLYVIDGQTKHSDQGNPRRARCYAYGAGESQKQEIVGEGEGEISSSHQNGADDEHALSPDSVGASGEIKGDDSIPDKRQRKQQAGL